MDRPLKIGIADSPENQYCEGHLRKCDLVVFRSYPEKSPPKNYRYSPMVVGPGPGFRKLGGVSVAWGKDDKALGDLVRTMDMPAAKIVVILGAGDGAATKVAKSMGATIETASSKRCVVIYGFNGKCDVEVLSAGSRPEPTKKRKTEVVAQKETPASPKPEVVDPKPVAEPKAEN